MQEVFSSAACPPEEALRIYVHLNQREFYHGELRIEDDRRFDLQLKKALTSPLSITHISSRSCLSYRRNLNHIRRNAAGFRMLWIVRQGSVELQRSQGACTIEAGQAGMTDADTPFKVTHRPNGISPYEAMQVMIPPDLFYRHLGEAEYFLRPFHLNGPHGKAFLEVLDLITRQASKLRASSLQALSLALLDTLGDHLRAEDFDLPQRHSIPDQRLKDIEDYILMHLTDPDMSYENVARNCGISSRYLSYLLAGHGTSFSDLLWRSRLARAHDLICAPATANLSIQEIAHMCGFKSGSHFSRRFKAAYGSSPREFRNRSASKTQSVLDTVANPSHAGR